MAITIRQPFASAIIEGFKHVENRGWAPQQLRAGSMWIAVHAGATAADPTDSPATAAALKALRNAWPTMRNAEAYPMSAVLGFMHIRDSVPVQRCNDAQAFGPQCWRIDAICKLTTPLRHIRGAQVLWPAPAALRISPRELDEALAKGPVGPAACSGIPKRVDHTKQSIVMTNDTSVQDVVDPNVASQSRGWRTVQRPIADGFDVPLSDGQGGWLHDGTARNGTASIGGRIITTTNKLAGATANAANGAAASGQRKGGRAFRQPKLSFGSSGLMPPPLPPRSASLQVEAAAGCGQPCNTDLCLDAACGGTCDDTTQMLYHGPLTSAPSAPSACAHHTFSNPCISNTAQEVYPTTHLQPPAHLDEAGPDVDSQQIEIVLEVKEGGLLDSIADNEAICMVASSSLFRANSASPLQNCSNEADDDLLFLVESIFGGLEHLRGLVHNPQLGECLCIRRRQRHVYYLIAKESPRHQVDVRALEVAISAMLEHMRAYNAGLQERLSVSTTLHTLCGGAISARIHAPHSTANAPCDALGNWETTSGWFGRWTSHVRPAVERAFGRCRRTAQQQRHLKLSKKKTRIAVCLYKGP